MVGLPAAGSGERRAIRRALGLTLVGAGLAGWLLIGRTGLVPAGERPLLADVDLAVSALGVASLFVVPKLWSAPQSADDGADAARGAAAVHVTSDLLTVLLEQAAAAEPAPTDIGLAVTPAGAFDDAIGLAPSTPVFTHLVPAGAAGSASAVFGVDIGVPPRETQGRFVSHPDCDPTLSKRDTLHEVVLVAIPPWDRASVAAYDRSGRRLSLSRVDERPPVEELPDGPTAAGPDQ